MESTEYILQIIALVVLLILSGFFSASETAMMSLSRVKIRQMKDEGCKGAGIVEEIFEKPKKLLSSILVGNNLVNIAATSISTSLLMGLIGKDGVAVATLAMTVLILLFGEITPKNIAANNSEKIAIAIAKPIKFIIWILAPLVAIFNVLTNIIFRLFGIKDSDPSSIITEEDLKVMVNVGHEEGVLEMEEREIINNVFEFGDMQAKNAMVQRIDMVTIDMEDSYDEVIQLFRAEKLSRMPVYNDTIDDIVGILNIKDIIFLEKEQIDKFKIADYMREPYFTYEFKKITQLLEDMKVAKAHIAIVLDEYGGTAGLLTIEDLVEVLVGDIEDEYDEDDDEIVLINEHEFVVDGSTKLEDVGEIIGEDLESDDFDSIGGYIIGHLDRLPEEGEIIILDDEVFVIEEIEKNRIKSIRLYTDVEELEEEDFDEEVDEEELNRRNELRQQKIEEVKNKYRDKYNNKKKTGKVLSPKDISKELNRNYYRKELNADKSANSPVEKSGENASNEADSKTAVHTAQNRVSDGTPSDKTVSDVSENSTVSDDTESNVSSAGK